VAGTGARHQEYGYWRYATDALAGGVAAARDDTHGGWTRFARPQFWPSSDSTAEEVVRSIAERGGFSVATARREVLPFLAAMTHHCKPRELTVAMAACYDFDEAAVSFVTGSGETTNKVESIVADARDRRESAMEEHSGAFGGRPPADDRDEDAETDATPTDDADDDAEADEAADDGQSGLSDFV
jgi:replication factor C large subunit